LSVQVACSLDRQISATCGGAQLSITEHVGFFLQDKEGMKQTSCLHMESASLPFDGAQASYRVT